MIYYIRKEINLNKRKELLKMDNRFNDLINSVKVNELFHKKEAEDKKKNCVMWVLAIVGVVTVIAAIAYAVYKFVTPDYYEDDDIDFDQDLMFDNYDEE